MTFNRNIMRRSNLIGNVIKYPYRRFRMVLTYSGLLAVLYLLGMIVISIPALVFLIRFDNVLITYLGTFGTVTALIGAVAYKGYRNTIQEVLNSAEKVTAESHPDLRCITEFINEESRKRNINPPDLYVKNTDNVNATALGRQKNGYIVLNNALLEAVENEKELKAIVAHEITHISNRDSIVSQILVAIRKIVQKSWTWFGYTAKLVYYERRNVAISKEYESVLYNRAKKKSIRLTTPIRLFTHSNSRHREYIADAEAAEITSPEAVKSALETLKNADKTEDDTVPQSLCIYGKTTEGFLSRLRRSHPPIEKRVNNLNKQFN